MESIQVQGPGPVSEAPARSLRVLLVEDSITVRLWIGHQVLALFPTAKLLEAEDGKTAIRMLSQHSVDLVITDLRMPGMDGQDLVQMLKRNPLLRRKPVLVVSAEAQDAQSSAWSQEPGLRLLPKPVTSKAFQAALLGLLGA